MVHKQRENKNINYFRNRNIHIDFLYNNSQYMFEKCNITYQYDISEEEIQRLNQVIVEKQLECDGNIEQIIGLTNRIHNIVKNGSINLYEFAGKETSEIINILKKDKVTGNCKIYAKILQDVLLVNGIISKLVFCKPMDFYFTDCHVVNHIYVKEKNKWIIMDPALNIYYEDEFGTILNLNELRDCYINKKKFYIKYINIEEKISEKINI